MKVKCLIVDDEPLARCGLESYIEQTPQLSTIGVLASAREALAFCRDHPVDLLFLDIQMPEMTGLDLMVMMPNLPKVIFTTAHREFALDGFELNAVDFLLKPFSYTRFLRAVKKAVESNTEDLGHSDPPYIFIKSNGMINRIMVDDIVLIETANDYVYLHTTKKKYLSLTSLKQMENKLPSSKFIRVHRYYLVGIKHIQKLEGNILYAGEHRVTISRSLKTHVYNSIIGNNLIDR